MTFAKDGAVTVLALMGHDGGGPESRGRKNKASKYSDGTSCRGQGGGSAASS